MLKVKNKEVISELAKSNYKANKKKNLLTVTAIFLTTFLISSVLSLGLSYWNTISLRQIRMNGMDYDIELSEPAGEQVLAVRQMDEVKYAGLDVKCAVVSRYQNRQLEKLRLFWLDDICWKEQTVPAVETYTGTYPEKESEIMLSESALKDMGISNPEPGMPVLLTYQSLSEDTSHPETQKEFTLSGWFTDYTGLPKGFVSEDFYRTTGVRQTDLTQGALKITLKNPVYSKEDIVQMQNKIGLSGTQFIDADYDTISNFCKVTAALSGLLILIFFSGYLFIYNTLYISVSKDIRYYGQLKTMGTTSVQLKAMIYKNVWWNSMIGIPLGLVLSAVIAKLIIPQALHIVNPVLSTDDVIMVPVWVFVIAAVFSLLTAFAGSLQPVRMAENCSPIEAVRYVGVSGKRKNHGVSPRCAPFGYKCRGGNLSSLVRQNLLRDKKQFAVILLSLSLAVSLFLIVNTIIYGNNAKLILNNSYDYDLRILNQTMLSSNEYQAITDDLTQTIRGLDGVEKVRIIKSAEAVVPYQEDIYGEYYKKLYKSRYSPGNYEEDMKSYRENPDHALFTCRIVGIDGPEFERQNKETGNMADKDDFENGRTAFVSMDLTGKDSSIVNKKLHFSLRGSSHAPKEESIRIGAVTDSCPAYYAGGFNPELIVSNSYLEKIQGSTITELVQIDYADSYSAETENSILNLIADNPDVSYDSKLDRYSEMKISENQTKVLGNSIGIIVMVLAVLNYVNMTAAGIQNRSKELAILESIGMTTKQIRKMIVLEGGSYAGISLVIASLSGIPLSYAVFSNLNTYEIPFSIPVIRHAVLFLVIIIICVTIPVLIFNSAYKKSVIERLRENEG